MTTKGKYATGEALRAALEERLKQIARTKGTELQRLRRQVAFDCFWLVCSMVRTHSGF
jgi:hypothetical protein